ncbi:MAG: VOC family protein [Geodermatophilaceae bacterium]
MPTRENAPDDPEALLVSPDGSCLTPANEPRRAPPVRSRTCSSSRPDDKTVKNRVHLDLRPTDRTRDEEVSRLLELGASLIDDRRKPR